MSLRISGKWSGLKTSILAAGPEEGRLFDGRGHLNKTTVHHAQCLRGRQREIKHTAFGEGTAVVDHHNHATLGSGVGYTQASAKR